MMKRLLVASILAVAFMPALFAAPRAPSLQPIPAQAVPNTRSPGEFVISFLDSDVQLNPVLSYTASEAQIYSGLYEGLVSYHPLTMEPVAAVAQSWDVSDDGLVYTFRIRRSARFSNGDPVTATDFRESWLNMIDPEIEAAYNFLFDVIDGAREYRTDPSRPRDSVGIEVVDDQTLRVRLRQPATHFLRILCHHAFVPVHESQRDVRDWSQLTRVVGNGPYRLEERSDEELVMVRNDSYWDRREVIVPRMRILFTGEDDDTVTDRFNRGEIDWVTSGFSLAEVQFPQSIVYNPIFATYYYFLNAQDGPFADARVRRALALLLPLEAIRDPEIHILPATTLVPPIPFYPVADGLAGQNIDEALALLDEAGYSRGVRLPTLTIRIPQGTEAARVADLMRSAWEEHLEVNVDVIVTPYPAYFDALADAEFTVGTVSWIGDFADPLTFLQMWVTGSNVNDAGFSDADFDRLIDDSMALRGEERYARLAEAEEILLQTGTVLPVSYSAAINLIDLQAVDGWFPNPLDIHPLRYIRFSDNDPAPGVINYRR